MKADANDMLVLRDPTLKEALVFIEEDDTNIRIHLDLSGGVYNCVNYANDFKQNAMAKGYKCAFVYLEFEKGGHAINAFNTIDGGLIYVEPQTDELIKDIAVGGMWHNLTIRKVVLIW